MGVPFGDMLKVAETLTGIAASAEESSDYWQFRKRVNLGNGIFTMLS
jgi:hypothetical protein